MRDALRIEIDIHGHSHAPNRHAVIPAADKLEADQRYTGRGVRIAFLDSGFYPHPDFADRVVEFHDVHGEEKHIGDFPKPQAHHWHGTQTVVVCAGNGSLSNGVYSGLARDAELVLVKVSAEGKIDDRAIEKGLEWIKANRVRLDIKVLNISLGGDCELTTPESPINQMMEELVESGVIITVAAGNSSEAKLLPPASAPSAITVGGYSDENQFESGEFKLYHSTFGVTADGIVKPELIAPAMFVAAPILPQTADYEVAETLSSIAASPDYEFRSVFLEKWRECGLPEFLLSTDVATARKFVEDELAQRKIVATHYQHVDGTSFAAPITASVVAQMLEANPDLEPQSVKNILLSTASKLSGQPAVRQGFGVLNAPMAVQKSNEEVHFLNETVYFPPRIERSSIIFSHHNDTATSVHLVGDFNYWHRKTTPCENDLNGIWRVEIPCLPGGKYRYKFLIDDTLWVEDATHGFKEEDGLGGFHSVLLIS